MNKETYQARLIRTLINSADVIPADVAQFLSQSDSAHWHFRDLVQDEYRPLADHLPSALVDYILRALIIKRPKDSFHSDDDWYFRNFGLRDDSRYFPPAHVHGPFLYLLRKNEGEGLRLVNTLTNHAVAVWREKFQHLDFPEQRSQTPIPVRINLSSGPREFWGDDYVYRWFRSTGVGPYPVASALMALEVWMEEQVANGRDPALLFEQVLAGSDCVALLGICLGIALAFPEKCLAAVLPIIKAPEVWRLDIARVSHDGPPTFRLDPLGRYKWIYDLIEERDKRPQRVLEVRTLAGLFLFQSDNELRQAFQDAVTGLVSNPPLYFEEEHNEARLQSLTELMELCQAMADPNNYLATQTPNGYQIEFNPPEHIRARNEAALEKPNQYLKWSSLNLWAQKTLDQGEPWHSMNPAEAVKAAQAFQTADDFSAPYGLTEWGAPRLQAITGVAAAVANVAFDWASEDGVVGWCRDVLVTAANATRQVDVMDSPTTNFPDDPKVSAGRGLAALVVQGWAEQDVREALLRLLGDPHEQVKQAALIGLKPAWQTDRVLCWNALRLGLVLANPPLFHRYPLKGDEDIRHDAWVREQVQKHLESEVWT